MPILLLGLAAWQAWSEALRWSDLAVLGILYVLTALGITVGFHRLLTHRSFSTTPWLRGVFAALGSAAIEGPVISWVADHRKHHACSDREGDPHSPHFGHGDGLLGSLRGLYHAHVGWLFIHTQRGSQERFAPDLLADPVIRFINRTFILWALVGLAIPFGLGVAIGGTVAAGLTALLWGGAVRVFVLHHVTYSVNSLCHMFGRRPTRPRTSRATSRGWPCHVRRGMAQQPSRVSDLRRARAGTVADRPIGPADRRAGEARAGLGRRQADAARKAAKASSEPSRRPQRPRAHP